MCKRWIMVPLMAMLAGCGDPLAEVEQVSEADAIPIEDAALALPTAEELNRDTPIFAGLFRRARPKPETSTAPDVTPLDENAALEDVVDISGEVDAALSEALEAPTNTSAVAQPAERRKGVLGWLRNAAASQTAVAAQSQAAAEPLEAPTPETADSEPDPVPVVVAVVAPPPEPQKRGLFGRVVPRKDAPRGPDALDVPVGAVLPFGEVARVCDARGRKLGKLVEQAARKGANYKLYDTAPDSAAPRTFYVTGFSDRCPRQFTAALALFGTPKLHEQLRYGLPAKEYPYSTTDRAYEKVKSQVCRVGRSKPCGPRIERLEQTTVFVSAYENFKDNARWADMLLHEGAVLAAALKKP